MNPSRERLLWFFGAAAVAAVSLGLVLIPAPTRLNQGREDLTDARAKKEIALRQGATFTAVEETRKTLNQQQVELDRYFGSTEGAVAFLTGLDGLAGETGVTTEVNFAQEPTAGVRKIPLTLTVTGPLPSRLTFLERLTARLPVTMVDSVDLSGGGTATLTIHAQVAWR